MKKAVVTALFVLLLAVAAGTWSLQVAGSVPSQVREPSTSVAASGIDGIAKPESGSEERRPLGTVSPATIRGADLRGTLTHADGSPAVGVPYWSWRDERPVWTRPTPEPRFLGPVPEPLPDSGNRTDEEGAWRVPAGQTAVTFAPFESILLTYEIGESPAALCLPPFSQIRLRLRGAMSDDRWETIVYPAIRDEPGQPRGWIGSHAHLPHAIGDRVVALSLRSRTFHLGGKDTVRYDAITGLHYAWSAGGRGIQIDRDQEETRAPADEVLNVLHRHAIVRFTVLDRDGELADVNGRVLFWEADKRAEKDLRFVSRTDIEHGVAVVGSPLPTDTEFLVRILVDDGEQLSTRFRIGAAETHKAVRVRRGTGENTALIVAVPGDADLQSCSVWLETPDGELSGLRRGAVFVEDLIRPTYVIGPGRTLVLRELPEGWRQLWLVTALGRVGQLDNPRSMNDVSVNWLPDTELEDILVAELLVGDDETPRELHFKIQLSAYSGRCTWVRVKSAYVNLQTPPNADPPLPEAWSMRAPLSSSYELLLWRGGDPLGDSKVIPVRRKDPR